MPEDEIYVLASQPVPLAPEDGRPVRLRGSAATAGLSRVPMDRFRSGMTQFMGAVRTLVGEISDKAGQFEVEHIEITGSIGADGKVAFLGSGVSVDSAASFKVRLVRPGSEADSAAAEDAGVAKPGAG